MKQFYYSLLSEYDKKNKYAKPFYATIEKSYSGADRYYHNFAHIKQMLDYKNSDIVSKMITRTANHFFRDKNESYELQLLLDFDLENIGSKSENYNKNSKLIRQEYRQISDEIFYAGRVDFLRKMLSAKFIYRTNYFKENYEKQARMNIKNEIKEIRSSTFLMV